MKRILNQSDPLAMQYRNSKTHAQMVGRISQNNQMCNQKNNEKRASLAGTIIVVTVVIIVMVVLIILITYMFRDVGSSGSMIETQNKFLLTLKSIKP